MQEKRENPDYGVWTMKTVKLQTRKPFIISRKENAVKKKLLFLQRTDRVNRKKDQDKAGVTFINKNIETLQPPYDHFWIVFNFHISSKYFGGKLITDIFSVIVAS